MGKSKLVLKRAKKERGTNSIWSSIDCYFAEASPRLIEALEKLEDLDFLKTGGFLNMKAANRLLAIAKMKDYCQEKNILIDEFIRTFQESDPLLQGQIEKGKLSLEEIEYLSTLKQFNLEQEVDSLKSLLLKTSPEINTANLDPELEAKLENIAKQNKDKILEIKSRLQKEMNAKSLPKDATTKLLIKSYQSIIPSIKRKRAKIHAIIKKEMDAIELKQKSIESSAIKTEQLETLQTKSSKESSEDFSATQQHDLLSESTKIVLPKSLFAKSTFVSLRNIGPFLAKTN